jgi:hypothetical protein
MLRRGTGCRSNQPQETSPNQLDLPADTLLEAIWETARNTVYFYDARGSRYLKIQLIERLAICAA